MITKSELLNDLIRQGCLRLGIVTMSQDIDENGVKIWEVKKSKLENYIETETIFFFTSYSMVEAFGEFLKISNF